MNRALLVAASGVVGWWVREWQMRRVVARVSAHVERQMP